MEIKVLDESGNPVESSTEVTNTPSGTLIPDGDLMRLELASTFDMKPSEASRYKKQLDGLIEYAKSKTDDHSPAGIKWAIRSLGTKLGTPPLGEKLVPYLYRYAYLYKEGRRIESEKDKFLRGEQDD